LRKGALLVGTADQTIEPINKGKIIKIFNFMAEELVYLFAYKQSDREFVYPVMG
jgi:hypothetical protein